MVAEWHSYSHLSPLILEPRRLELLDRPDNARSEHLPVATAVEWHDSKARWPGCPALVGELRHGGACNNCLCEMVCAGCVSPACVVAPGQLTAAVVVSGYMAAPKT